MSPPVTPFLDGAFAPGPRPGGLKAKSRAGRITQAHLCEKARAEIVALQQLDQFRDRTAAHVRPFDGKVYL
ncbi:MAG: hypothetical protein M3371_09510 [Acidobacteriota bacterium]|nr:hypothetical protein [Acidobacteriota bacterium]